MNRLKIQSFLKLHWPAIFFGIYTAIILTAILILKPGWGFMDDSHNLINASDFWSGKRSLMDMFQADAHDWGRFRPLYHVWVITAYALQSPLAVYLLITVVGFAVILLWGQIFVSIFKERKVDAFTLYVYPMSFFIFTPSWNIFMYASVQEKFIYIFGTIAVYFLVKAYHKDSFKSLFVSFLFVILAMLGKETGLALMASFFIFAIADLFLFRYSMRLSRCLAGMSFIVMAGHIFFIRSILGGYTAGYKTKMNIPSMVKILLAAPLMIKLIVLIAVMAIFSYLVLWFRSKSIQERMKPHFLIMPFFILAYTAILLPWCFANYLLAPLGAFIGATFYLFFILVASIHKTMEMILRGLVVILLILVLGTIIIPRISKMGDKRSIVAKLVDMRKQEPQAKFFYPPPMEETAGVLHEFTLADIVYTPKVNRDILSACGKSCYLLVNDEAGSISLIDVQMMPFVYRSGTWAVYPLRQNAGFKSEFSPDFKVSILDQLKRIFKKTHHS